MYREIYVDISYFNQEIRSVERVPAQCYEFIVQTDYIVAIDVATLYASSPYFRYLKENAGDSDL